MRIHSGGRIIPSPSPKDKRRRIHDAAVKVFAEKGFFGARVSDIAREAGVADGTIYLYFKNKDDLLISLFEDRMDEIMAAFEAQLEGLDPPAQLERFVAVHLEMVAERPRLAEVLTVELHQSSKFMHEYRAPGFQRYLGLLEAIIERGQAQGLFATDLHPKLLKRVIFGALDEVALHWVSTRRKPYALDDAARQIWTICARGLMRGPGDVDH